MKITPLNGNLFITIERPNEISGLIIVRKKYEDQEETILGKVLYAPLYEKELKPGAAVLILGHAGTYAGEHKGKTLRAISKDDILAEVLGGKP